MKTTIVLALLALSLNAGFANAATIECGTADGFIELRTGWVAFLSAEYSNRESKVLKKGMIVPTTSKLPDFKTIPETHQVGAVKIESAGPKIILEETTSRDDCGEPVKTQKFSQKLRLSAPQLSDGFRLEHFVCTRVDSNADCRDH